jgi:hypothetical protein
MRYKLQLLPDEGEITTMVTSSGGCIVVGTSRGAVVLLSPDLRRNITPRPNLADCHVLTEHACTPPDRDSAVKLEEPP